ncbi:unnamed protein product [Nezara viridula]|uniref:Ionotropic glutamate receptor C-terminal domain-containing protein n=1 Tax=Nezara viridula TaxID=85310 RepID=A0A9P0E7N0_NEZVI|nr:unnamed protein product [Nezara viridula]
MRWELLLALIRCVSCGMLGMFHWNRDDLIDAVEFIAKRNFHGNCLCFFYPRQDPPDLIFSNLLVRMNKRWTPIVPTILPSVSYLKTGKYVVANFIKCSYVIPIRNYNYTSQLQEIMYHPWNTLYRVGDSPHTRFIVVVDGEILKDEAYKALKMMFLFGDIDVIIVGLENNVVSTFTLFPYGKEGESCPEDNVKLSRIAQWNGQFTEVDFFPNKVPNSFRGCDFPVSTVRYPPFMFSTNDGKYDGIDYRLIEIITEKINASLRIIFYSGIDGWLWQKGGKIYGSLNDLREGYSWATVSGISNNLMHYPVTTIESPYVFSKLMWYFPNPLPIEKWKFVYLAFSVKLWISCTITAVLTPCFFYLFANVRRIEFYFTEFEKSCFTLWSIAFGNSTGFMPKTVYFRFLFSLWLFFTIHLNLAYTASLTGLITGGKMESKVTTLDDIVERNLTTAMFSYLVAPLSTLKEPKVRKAVSSYVVVNNYDEIFTKMITFRNLSIVDNDVYIDHLIFKKKLQIYQTPVTLLRVPTGVMMRRNHFMFERIDKMVQRLILAGISDKLVEDFTVPLWKHQDKTIWKAVDIDALAGPFILYGCGIFLSIAAFFIEIIYFHRKKFNLLK